MFTDTLSPWSVDATKGGVCSLFRRGIVSSEAYGCAAICRGLRHSARAWPGFCSVGKGGSVIGTVRLGCEVLFDRLPTWFREKRIGLLANQASVDGHFDHIG